MTIRSRTLSLAGATVAAGVLFVAGTVAAGAENPPATPPVDAGTATTVASDPAPVTTDTVPTTTTTAAAAEPAPTTTAADPAPATTPAAPATTTAPPPPPTTTTAAPRFDPWAALLAWLAAQAEARRARHPAPPAPTTTEAAPPAAAATTAPGAAPATSSRPSDASTPSAPSDSSSSATSSAAPADAAPALAPAVAQPAPAHLTIAAAATPGAITVGSTVTYAFTVTNSGGRATTAAFNDTLPADVTPIAADADQGTCSGGRSVSCSLGSIAPGQTVTVTVVVQVAQATAFQNAISLTAGDPNARIDSAGGPLRLQASTAAPVKLPVAAAKKKAMAKKKAVPKKPAKKHAAAKQHAARKPTRR